MRHNIRAWGQAFLSGDRKSLWVQGLLDNGDTIDLEIPFPLASQLVEGFALAGQQASMEFSLAWEHERRRLKSRRLREIAAPTVQTKIKGRGTRPCPPSRIVFLDYLPRPWP
jgi:hypothetical protein